MSYRYLLPAVMFAATLAPNAASALTMAPTYAGSYSVASLGSVPGLPALYGGLTFLDSDTILIGGSANTAAGRIYSIDVVRGGDNHITGFSGSATLYNDDGSGSGIGEYNDGGVVFGPGGVLFTSRWPVNELGQTKPGSTDEDRVIDLATLGVAGSHSAINFVPSGFGGAGGVKLVSWSGGEWYDADISPDGTGTFDIINVTQVDLDLTDAILHTPVPGGPEGFVYIPAGNPLFPANALLVAEYSAGLVGAYDLDADGNPLVATRRDFVTGLTGAEGAAIDPVTGDFLFSTFGGGNQVVRVQGFNIPGGGGEIPEPTSLALFGLGLAVVGWSRARKRT